MKRIRRDAVEPSDRFRKRVERRFPRGELVGEEHLFWRLARAFEEAHARRVLRGSFSGFARWSCRRRERVVDAFGGERDFPPLWRGDDIGREVKERLSAMTGGTCAWCESQVAGAQHGEVEHVRPKSRFPTRAYDWDNFLFSCQHCNQKKSDRWPAHGRFVRPDHDDPRRHLEFTDDGRVRGRTREGWQTIVALDLNREDLVRSRRTQIDLVLRPLRLARNAGVDAAWLSVLVEGARPAAAVAFSAAVTACLERWR